MTRKHLDYTLQEYTRLIVQHFLQELDQTPVNFHELVITQVETALLQEMLKYSKANLTKCAQYLGLNRATLRKKIKLYGLDAIA